MDIPVISKTDFTFPGQTNVYHGKVRDVYTIGNETLISVASDRVSAFDVVLPRQIPAKGQVLNQVAAHFLKQTADIIPNWLHAAPDPNVSIGVKAEPVMIEVVVRAVLVGHAWRIYRDGGRELCGNDLPEGLKEYDNFPAPIITPTTKAAEGHDEDISEADILAQALISPEDWQNITTYARKLFARGQAMANARGLVLADTKYEFGKYDGQIILIDEVHTPDSSRYFYADGYNAYVSGQTAETPRSLSKEFLRQWLLDRDFDGHGKPPEMPDDFVQKLSERYIELYENLTGVPFAQDTSADPVQRIEANVLHYLQETTA